MVCVSIIQIAKVTVNLVCCFDSASQYVGNCVVLGGVVICVENFHQLNLESHKSFSSHVIH